ncbi:acyl-CoA dehydrogenase family protein [Streptomyces sp. S.PNR 29]|uniref:acyl-CoA dehydrogenase family protein n=1 Tax=Streptomyces sp. S.PNR 29 TaxID=2973805 RepID=UPI0025AF14F4|nr:acyl-CoA dehydrogenase family protein [Streptomyces sp. S.PNR 29]MDN0194389.1 acyl-CoA dehydrogenase family protein [Streptomyces sp. S.PNR 29]
MSMFAMTAEQEAIRSTAMTFAEEYLAPNAVDWDRQRHFPVDVLRKAAEVGMGGINVREESGGSGLSRSDAVLVFEALAAGCPSISAYLSIHNMVATMIDTYGDQAQRDRWVGRLCRMDDLASYCLTEPGAGSDAAAIRTRAEREGDSYVLSGTKQFTSGAGTSQTYLVMARTSEDGARGITAFIVDKDTDGLSFGAEERKMGWNAQPTRQVIMDRVRVPEGNRLSAEGAGFKIAMNALNGGRLNIAACSLGGARSALERSLSYLGQREAFGARLLDMPTVQFQLADMAASLEASQALLQRSAAALDQGSANAVELCAMAKGFCTDAGFSIANQALQLHGGYGYLSDYGLEKIVRDLRVHQILEGTNEIMRLIVGRGLASRA